MRSLPIVVLAACNGPDGDGTPNTPPPRAWSAEVGPVAVLTEPGGGDLHSHATLAWNGDASAYLVTWAAGFAPNAKALAARFAPDGAPIGPTFELSGAGGDKPDVEWDGSRWIVTWNDSVGRVFLAEIAPDGTASTPVVLQDTDIDADAVDLAVQPGGAGVAIWTEFGADWMGEFGGRIAWKAFGSDLQPLGDPKIADESSKKAADAAPLPDGGWVGAWAIDYDHPTRDDFYYEVWGRLYRGDGSAWSWRADDLDSAWPSRPAIAADPDGRLAVSWRDKSESDGAGLGSGAYVRLFDGDATARGPSLALGPEHDGDRVVTAWAGPLAVVCWQETDADGLAGIVLSAVDGDSGEVVVDRVAVHEPGGDRDERPSIVVREAADDGWDVLVIWETIEPGTGAGRGLRARTVTLR